MGHTRFLTVGRVSLCLALGVLLMACTNDGGEVTIDLGLACTQSLVDFNRQGCRDTADARIDGYKDCVMDCGPADEPCLEGCLETPGSAFSECTGDVPFLFSGVCGECPVLCALDFQGDADSPGCLFDPTPTGEQCLDELYECVNGC